MFKKYTSAIRSLVGLRKVSSQEAGVVDYLTKRSKRMEGRQGIILCQCPEDIFYLGLFGRLVLSIKERGNFRVEQYLLHSLRPGECKSYLAFLYKRIENWALNKKWCQLYFSFCDGVGYKSACFEGPFRYFHDLFRSYFLWQGIKSKEDLVLLRVDGYVVGDLINDTYIRWRPSYTVDLADRYLWRVIRQTLKELRLARLYFSKKKVRIFITSHCNGYIQHGIAVRVALNYGVDVYGFGNRQEFCKKLSLTDWVAAKNPDCYAIDFSFLNDQQHRLEMANFALSARLAGGVDRATSYMRQSAYLVTDEPVPDVTGAVVVFLHCFYDAPHGYRHTVFPDFWEWACFTIKFLSDNNVKFFIKPHPSWLDASEDVYQKLLYLFPDVPRISPKVTNKQLANAGMICAVSVHGTVTHELAYLGIPTVSCGDNPHVAFEFCNTAGTRTEYAEALLNAQKLRPDKDSLRHASLVFFYMHNLNIGDIQRDLLDVVSNFSKDFDVLRLDEISSMPGFAVIIDKMIQE